MRLTLSPRIFQIWAFSFLAGLYMLRGMLEFPSTGWQFQTILTVGVGLGLLPLLAAIADTAVSWRGVTIIVLSLLGLMINAVLLVLLWAGMTPIAWITLLIAVLYASVACIEFRSRENG